MKNMTFLVLSVLILSACGQANSTPQGQGYPDELSPYLEAFKDEAAAHGRTIPANYLYGLTMSFGDAATYCGVQDSVGCCRAYANGSRVIVVDSKAYSKMTAPQRYEVLFHEFGHCFLDQMTHRDGLDVTGHPVSVLHSTMFDSTYFAVHINEYMGELFDFH